MFPVQKKRSSVKVAVAAATSAVKKQKKQTGGQGKPAFVEGPQKYDRRVNPTFQERGCLKTMLTKGAFEEENPLWETNGLQWFRSYVYDMLGKGEDLLKVAKSKRSKLHKKDKDKREEDNRDSWDEEDKAKREAEGRDTKWEEAKAKRKAENRGSQHEEDKAKRGAEGRPTKAEEVRDKRVAEGRPTKHEEERDKRERQR